MNDTMRTLTIFAAILLPLTLVVGIYGMNGLDLNDLASLPSGFPDSADFNDYNNRCLFSCSSKRSGLKMRGNKFSLRKTDKKFRPLPVLRCFDEMRQCFGRRITYFSLLIFIDTMTICREKETRIVRY